MSLTSCLKKLGKNVSAEDRAAIQELAAQNRKDGMAAQDAAVAAVRSHMDGLGTQMQALRDTKPGPDASASASRGTQQDAGEAPSLDTQLAQKLAAEQPDLRVVLPGSDEHITVAEAMQRIAEEQKQDGHWADLVNTAVQCALTAA
jgi:hypothetical protein